MRCSGCGTEIKEDQAFCPECGLRVGGEVADTEKVEAKAPDGEESTGAVEAPEAGDAAAPGRWQPPPKAPVAGKAEVAGKADSINGWAIASLVMGLLGLTCVPLLGAVLAIVFGGIARSSIKHGKGGRKGGGMATAGLVLGTVGLVIPVILVAVLVPVGIVYVWPRVEAGHDLLKGADAARFYYVTHDNSYTGMNARALASLDSSVTFRNSPGTQKDVVYVQVTNDQAARLYIYASTGDRFVAFSIRNQWHYNFRVGRFQLNGTWDDWR